MRSSETHLFLLSFLALNCFSSPAVAAAPQCAEMFSHASAFSSAAEISKERAKLVVHLRESGVPAFLKKVSTGELPVLLVNDSTVSKLTEFMSHSIGIQMLLQPEDPRSDHGSFRLGGFKIPDAQNPGQMRDTNLQIDWAPTGTRMWKPESRAELHSTGYAWRDQNELMQKATKNNYSKIAVELTFIATSQQRSNIEYYQRMRRAALIAISSESIYGGPRPWVPNLIPDQEIVEDCFDVSRGRKLAPMLEIISRRLRDSGIADVREFINDAKTRRFLTAARAALMTADAWNWDTFNHELIVRNAKAYALGQKILPASMNGKSAVEIESFLNSVVAYESVHLASEVFIDLGIDGNIFPRGNLENPKLAARPRLRAHEPG